MFHGCGKLWMWAQQPEPLLELPPSPGRVCLDPAPGPFCGHQDGASLQGLEPVWGRNEAEMQGKLGLGQAQGWVGGPLHPRHTVGCEVCISAAQSRIKADVQSHRSSAVTTSHVEAGRAALTPE